MSQLKQQQLIIFFMIKLLNAINNFPQILTKTSNQTFNLSSTAILTCHVRDLGEHHVTWFKYDSITSLSSPLAVGKDLFTTDKRYSITSYSTSTRDSYWSLEIYQLNLSDEGIYLCKISNRRQSISISIHLHIHIPMSISPAYLYAEPGTNVKLNCTIATDNQTVHIPIHWYFLSTQLNQTKFNDVSTKKHLMNDSLISYLIIHNAQTYHSGIWTCLYKRQRRTAKLIVEKNALQRQRISALLSNNSNQRYSLSNLFVLFIIINYYYYYFFLYV